MDRSPEEKADQPAAVTAAVTASEAPKAEAASEAAAPEAAEPVAAAPAETTAPEAAATTESAAPEAVAPAETAAPEAPAEAAAPAETAASAAEEAAAVAAAPPPAPTPKKGAKIKGRIVKIGEEAAFVDFGGREEAALDLQEIRDPDGKLTRKVGDEVRGAVTQIEGGIKMSLRAARSLPKNLPLLIQAASDGTPVEGKITSVNKGGLVVHVMGVRGFCPFSQVDRHYVEDPTTFVGRKLTFRVASADDKGRNVVLSRRALLEEDAKAKADEIRKSIAVDQVLKGTVARIRPFGAFVDLGGIDGLLHVSEISHTRIHDPSAVLKLGQEIEVKVRSVENLGTKDERIGLSMKQLKSDPWEEVANRLQVGARVPAKVVRIAPFGAFLELAPGVDGLAHVSTLAEGHVDDPSDVVSVGQAVEPWVVSVDAGSRRISLSLREPTGEEDAPRRRGGGGGGRREDRGRRSEPAPREHKSMPASGPGMTSMEEAFERLRNQRGN